MLALGICVASTLPTFWKTSRKPADFGLIVFCMLVAGWFAWRAWLSPIEELGQADLLLLAGAVGTFISIRGIEGNRLAEKILIWGIALFLLANVIAIGMQMIDPTFSPVLRSRASVFPSGFYAHYNEAANYLIASSMLVGASALCGRQGGATRIFWGLIAISGLAAVYFTRSRGGILGAAVGSGVFVCAGVVIGKRDGARWFAPAVVAVPMVGIAIVVFLSMGWNEAQEIRRVGEVADFVLDNNLRLFILGVASSCIGLHPVAGGGSRSFSWECFRFINPNVQGGLAGSRPEMAHNELIQSATDYGLVGTFLLIGLLGGLALMAILKILFESNSGEHEQRDVWRLGALAGLTGMLIQSSFSFVFHLFPGVLLLGICLGQLSRPSATSGAKASILGTRILLTAVLVPCTALLLCFGWKGGKVTGVLWPVYFDKTRVISSETKIAAFTAAIDLWPQSSLYQERATALQTVATREGDNGAVEEAISDYRQAMRLHPKNPELMVNFANLLSQKQQDQEAEAAYERAIQIQGGMEPAFQAHYFLANHLLGKGIRLFNPQDPSLSLAALEAAAQQIEQSFKELVTPLPEKEDARVSVHESLGAAREASGDYHGAMRAFDFESTLLRGGRGDYRAGLLNGKLAAQAWAARRPSEALGYFIEAKRRIGLTNDLPSGVNPVQRVEYLAYLDKTIAYLRGAKVEPAVVPPR